MAAWIRHASRTLHVAIHEEWRKGEEYMVSYPWDWDSGGKLPVIPDDLPKSYGRGSKGVIPSGERPRPY